MQKIEAVILDWAGTVVDFGSVAPTTIFVEAFKRTYDFEISLEEARGPMGMGKWDHIRTLGSTPAVAERWLKQFGSSMSDEVVDEIYRTFMPLQKAKVAGYRVGGKTGTSFKAVAGGYGNDYVGLFAGIAPISDPKVVVVVVINDPGGDLYHGGEVAAPVFSRVMEGALRVLNVVPDASGKLASSNKLPVAHKKQLITHQEANDV